jgi:hypothetical protein
MGERDRQRQKEREKEIIKMFAPLGIICNTFSDSMEPEQMVLKVLEQ